MCAAYIGATPVPQATQTRQTFVATAAQTSFATGGYQAGYLDVFLNGVKLQDNVDYTATNGSDIVLTVGAALDDTLEVVAYTAFEVLDQTFTGTTTTEGLTVTGAFTSKGIDDNATSTAVTIDPSGHLIVGKTAIDGTASTGVELRNAGTTYISRAGANTLYVNRDTDDGSIIELRKDGAPVGSIGATGGYLTVTASGGSDAGAKLGNSAIFPCNTDGSDRDDGINLGLSDVRWKNLYLSGGVVFGTGGPSPITSNTLDDYEEGTWTPSIGGSVSDPSVTYQPTRYGGYVKIGRQVTLTVNVETATLSGGSGGAIIKGLPFAPTSDSVCHTGAIETDTTTLSSGYTYAYVAMFASNAFIYYRQSGSGQNEIDIPVTNLASAAWQRMSITYFTDA